MVAIASREDAEIPRTRYTNPKGDSTWATVFFGTIENGFDPEVGSRTIGARHPTARFIEAERGFVSHPHFHVADQFQVFVAGDGVMGKTPLRDVTVHYASAYSPYGPFRAGATGLAWFTLANGWDWTQHYMPEFRDELRAAGRSPRGALCSVKPFSAQDRSAMTATTCDTLIEPENDGLAAWRYAIPANATLKAECAQQSGGMYLLLISGSGWTADRQLPEYSVIYMESGEGPVTIVGGERGLDILAMQFPLMVGSSSLHERLSL